MKFAKTDGIHRGTSVLPKASGAEIVSTTHPSFDTPENCSSVVVTVAITAGSGTPTMTVVVEGSVDGGATWIVAGTIGLNGYLVGTVGTAPTNFTAAATTIGVFSALPLMRTRSVIAGGTPSLTYSVAVEAVA